MEQLKVIGLDLAKNVFQVHGMDETGKKLFGKKLKRAEVLTYFAQHQPVLIGMEACGGAHPWARQLVSLGHRIKIMAPQHVKPFVQGNKTDARDAAAIAEAALRQSVPSVAMRTAESQQMQALHRVRELWMKQRIALTNQIRGLLTEFGHVMPRGIKRLKAEVSLWQAQVPPELTVLKGLIEQLMTALREQEERISQLETGINALHKHNPASRLIESIPGVGLLSATAVVARFGQCEHVDSARKFASCIGLTPREHSSGGTRKQGHVTKHGNPRLRAALVECAWRLVRFQPNYPPVAKRLHLLAKGAKATGAVRKKAIVAVARRLAVDLWRIHSGQCGAEKLGLLT